jgi:RHS repeat-associated protein
LDGAVFTAGKSGKVPYGKLKRYYRNQDLVNAGGGNTNQPDYDEEPSNKVENLQFYYHPDHLGSSSYITDVSGEVYQHMEYFPFGETFIEERTDAEYTSYLYNGKELDEETGLYYYGARYYDARISMWYGVDPKAEKYPYLSCYAFSGLNPIKLIDPNGKEFTVAAKEWAQKLWDNVTSRMQQNAAAMNDNMTMIETGINRRGNSLTKGQFKRAMKKIDKLSAENKRLNQVTNELISLENSSQMYDVKVGGSTGRNSAGELTYDSTTGNVVISIYSNSNNQLATFAHESKHAFQFETGKVSLAYGGNGGSSLYDVTDEIDAYIRGQLFGENKGVRITEDWVRRRGYEGLKSGPIDFNTLTNNPMYPGETYKQAIEKSTTLLKSAGKDPIQVIKR